MNSKKCAEPLDLEQGLPVTQEDVHALRMKSPKMDTEQYLQWLSLLVPPTQKQLRARKGPGPGPSFRLP
jgi:hypothetical protein